MKSVCCSRKELQPVLAALKIPLAPETAGADGDLGLHHVVAGAERVRLGIHEGPDAGLLVGFQKLPPNRQRGNGREAEVEQRPHAQSGHDHDGHGDEEDQHGGAEIRLQQHQREHRRAQHQRHAQGREGISGLVVAKRLGEHQHQHQLGELRRLEREEPQVQPPLRASAADADDQHQRQQYHHRPVDGVRPAVQVLVVHGEGRDHHHEGDGEPIGLLGGEVARAFLVGAARGAVDGHDAKQGQPTVSTNRGQSKPVTSRRSICMAYLTGPRADGGGRHFMVLHVHVVALAAEVGFHDPLGDGCGDGAAVAAVLHEGGDGDFGAPRPGHRPRTRRDP